MVADYVNEPDKSEEKKKINAIANETKNSPSPLPLKPLYRYTNKLYDLSDFLSSVGSVTKNITSIGVDIGFSLYLYYFLNWSLLYMDRKIKNEMSLIK